MTADLEGWPRVRHARSPAQPRKPVRAANAESGDRACRAQGGGAAKGRRTGERAAQARGPPPGRGRGRGPARPGSARPCALDPREGDDTVPRGRAYDATRRAVDFVLKKPGPKRSNTKPSTTSTSMPTFKGAVAVDAAAKAWRFQVDSIQVQGQDQLPSLRSATSPGTRGSRLRWSEP